MGDRILREKTYISGNTQITVRRDLRRNGTGIRVSVECKDRGTRETLWKEHKDYVAVAAGDYKFFKLCEQYRRETSSK